MGAITDVVKRYVPASYRAMCAISNSYYSLTELQALADYVKLRVFSTDISVGNEGVVWNKKEVQLLGMLTTLEFIPGAIDYWGDQLSSESTVNENATYFDRRQELWKLFDKLALEAQELAGEIGVTVVGGDSRLPAISYGDNGRGILDSPEPRDFGGLYADRAYTLPWGS